MPDSQGMSAREKSVKEITSTAPVNRRMVRKPKSLTADVEQVFILWMEDQISRSIPLSQRLLQAKPSPNQFDQG